MKVLIVEDEIVIAADLMQMLFSSGYEVAGPAVDYPSALALINYEKPDLVLVDINLIGEKDGIDLAKTIHLKHHIPFIFTSALSDPQTIARAKVTQPATYLVKPFREDQLLASITVALTNFANRQSSEINSDESLLLINEAIFIKEKKSFYKISIEDILWLKASDNYVEVFTLSKKYLVRSPLSGFAKKLNDPRFFKIHKSYLINLDHLTSIHPDAVEIKGHILPLAKNYVPKLLKKLQTF